MTVLALFLWLSRSLDQKKEGSAYINTGGLMRGNQKQRLAMFVSFCTSYKNLLRKVQ